MLRCRYLYLWGAEECSGKNLKAKIDAGYCVGVVSDGATGMQCVCVCVCVCAHVSTYTHM